MRVIKGRHCTTFSLRGFQFDLSSSPLMIQASLHVQWVDLQEEDKISAVRNPLTVPTCELKKKKWKQKKTAWWVKWMNPTLMSDIYFPRPLLRVYWSLFAHSCISSEPPLWHLTWSTEDVGQNCRSSTFHSEQCQIRLQNNAPKPIVFQNHSTHANSKHREWLCA